MGVSAFLMCYVATWVGRSTFKLSGCHLPQLAGEGRRGACPLGLVLFVFFMASFARLAHFTELWLDRIHVAAFRDIR